MASLLALTLLSCAWAGQVSNSTCLLQRKSNVSSVSLFNASKGGRSATGGYEHWYCGALPSLQKLSFSSRLLMPGFRLEHPGQG